MMHLVEWEKDSDTYRGDKSAGEETLLSGDR